MSRKSIFQWLYKYLRSNCNFPFVIYQSKRKRADWQRVFVFCNFVIYLCFDCYKNNKSEVWLLVMYHQIFVNQKIKIVQKYWQSKRLDQVLLFDRWSRDFIILTTNTIMWPSVRLRYMSAFWFEFIGIMVPTPLQKWA